jgi:hypothetical protein
LGGPPSANLYLTRGGETKRLGEPGKDFFGYIHTEQINAMMGDYLDYREGWIYVTWGDVWTGSPLPAPAKVNADTGEIVPLEGF